MKRLLVVPALLLCACTTPGEAPDAFLDAAEVASPDEPLTSPCAGLPDLTGRVSRVTDFVATAPTDGINPTWKKWADAYDLVMMFRFLHHDRAAGSVDAVVACGGAELAGGRDGPPAPERLFFALDPTPVSFTLDGCDLTIAEPIDIHLFTPFVSGEIPISRVIGAGAMSEDGAEITHLDLSGSLGEETAATTCIDIAGLGVVNLHWFFSLAGICPDVDGDGDGAVDAYNFLGWIRAVDATYLFDDGLELIASLVPDCEVHAAPCP